MKAVLQTELGPTLHRDLIDNARSGLTILSVREGDKDALLREIRDADVLLHVLDPVDRQVIEAGSRLKLIQKLGVGVNTIDRRAAAERGIIVANTPGANSQAVAEHTLALMLAALRRIVPLDHATRRGAGWAQSPKQLERSGEIAGRIVGLVGFGAVPRLLAPILRAIGAQIVCTTGGSSVVPGYVKIVSMEELVATADIISLHIPLNPDTRGILGKNLLSTAKAGALIVNTARGELVDEDALYDMIEIGHLSGAAVDVFASEPAVNNKLWDLEEVSVTPHIAWYTPESIRRSFAMAYDNIRRLETGEELMHQVPYNLP